MKKMLTYNAAHFGADVVEKMDKKIKVIYQCESLVLSSIKAFLKSTKNYEQTENFVPFIHLVIKIRFNLEAAHRLLPLLKADYRFKTSINLQYRSCLDDTINTYYLLGFVVVDNATKRVADKQPSLGNELDILHREFLKSIFVIIESEIETAQYYNKLCGKTYTLDENTKDWRQELIDGNSHLYNSDTNTWKNNKEIRVTSSTLFDRLFPLGNNKIPESGKIEFIKKKRFSA